MKNPEHDGKASVAQAGYKVVRFACVFVLLESLTVLAGWALADSRIIHLFLTPHYGTAMPLTGVGLLLCSCALWLVRSEDDLGVLRRGSAALLAATVLAFALLVMLEYAAKIDFGIDLLLFPETLTRTMSLLPGRPAIVTALSLLVFSFALLSIDVKSRFVQRIVDALLLLILVLAAQRCLSFLYGEVGRYTPRWKVFGQQPFAPMSPMMGVAFIVLFFGLLYARPQRRTWMMRILYVPGPARDMARWLVPVAVMAPILFGLLGTWVNRAGLEETSYPFSLLVIAMIMLQLLVLFLSARAIGRSDQTRSAAEAELRRLSAIIEATTDFVGMADPQGHALYVNAAGCRMTGIKREDVATLAIPDFHPAAEARRVVREAVPLAVRDGVWVGESKLRSTGPGVIPVSQVILAHKDDNGKLAYLSTIMRDITQRERLEASQRFLLDVSRESIGATDIATNLRNLVRLVVPAHATSCAIYLTRPDGLIQNAARARIAEREQTIDILRTYSHAKRPCPLVERVLRTGEPVVLRAMSEADLKLLVPNGRHGGLLRNIPHSAVALPLRSRDHTLAQLCSFAANRRNRSRRTKWRSHARWPIAWRSRWIWPRSSCRREKRRIFGMKSSASSRTIYATRSTRLH